MAPSHNYLAQFRERTGLSQSELADLLGVSRSVINMCERDERLLPTNAGIQFSRLQMAMDNPAKVAELASSRPVVNEDAVKKELLKSIQKLRYKTIVLARKIATNEKQHEQLQQKRLLLDIIAQQHLQTTPTDVQKAAFAYVEISTKLITDQALHAHRLDKLRHAVLMYEVGEMEKILMEMENG